MSEFNYQNYINDVLNNRILVCEAVKLAVKRHVKDIEKSKTDNFDFYFDTKEAQRPITFIQNLNHSKGKWAIDKTKINLEPWQQFIVASVFGWRKKSDSLRRFRKVYIQVARKNGKTTLLSGVANYCYFCDSPKEPGVEVYFIATKKEQAKLAWEDMERMIRKCASLKGLATTYKQTSTIIKKTDTASKAKILGQDSNTEDGLNPHFIGVDEFHAHPSDELINVLESGTGARRQPLTFIITTAGFDKNSVCFKEYTYLKSILNNTITNDTYFAMIFEPDIKDDWKSREAIVKSNPNLNISAGEDMILNRITESLDKPHQQVDVKTKNINIWTQSSTTWIPLEIWEHGNTPFDFETLKQQKCTLGIDLSTTRDITAVAFCFKVEDKYILKLKYFMPGTNIRERSQEDKVPYELWAESGYIALSQKDTIDFDMIEEYIKHEGLNNYEIIDCGYDAWKAKEIVDHLEKEGLKMTAIRQTFALGGISEGTAHFERLVYEKRIIHCSDPVLTWMLTCTEVVTDGRENYRPVKPDRKKSTKRIDGILAAIMAIQTYIATENTETTSSVYDTGDLIVI